MWCRAPGTVLALACLLGSWGCASYEDSLAGDSDGSEAGSGGFSDPGGGGNEGGASGSPSGRDGGASANEGRGGSAQGGSTASGGASGMGGAAPPCSVDIRPVSTASLASVPAGPGRTVTIRAIASGAPGGAAWQWTVALSGTPVPFQSSEPGHVTFSVERPGSYVVSASLMLGPDTCRGVANVVAVDPLQRTQDVWLRVIPPRGGDIPPFEDALSVSAGGPAIVQNLALPAGVEVPLDPMREGALAAAVPSYVKLTSRASSFTIEGRSDEGPRGFVARLDPRKMYDLLVVPSDGASPALFKDQSTSSLPSLPILIGAGAQVSGSLATPAGPVGNARVLLRAGILPSTLGSSGVDGGFAVFANPGLFGVFVRAPEGSGLPDLNLPDAPGIPVATTSVNARILWTPAADVAFSAVVRTASGGPSGPGVRVQLLSAAPITNAATLTVNANAPAALAGEIRIDRVTNAAGRVDFGRVPRGPYRLKIVPPDAMSPASGTVTVVPVDVQADRKDEPVNMAAAVNVRGRLEPADRAAGGTILAVDADDPTRAPAVALVAADGAYTLSLSPHARYRLRARPAGRGLPVVFLGAVERATATTELGVRRIPTGVSVSGIVTSRGGTPIAGALVEVYCVGETPDCVRAQQPSVVTAIPIGTTTTDGRGGYRVFVGDPGTE
jgi:hypothetical protein